MFMYVYGEKGRVVKIIIVKDEVVRKDIFFMSM